MEGTQKNHTQEHEMLFIRVFFNTPQRKKAPHTRVTQQEKGKKYFIKIHFRKVAYHGLTFSWDEISAKFSSTRISAQTLEKLTAT